MGFEDSVEDAAKDMGSGGDFYKFREGDNKLRIMSEPIIKVFRFGYGICYEGAPYCQKETLDKELEEAKAKAKAEGKDVSKVSIRLPSKKWECWAIVRGKDDSNALAIVDLPYGVSKALLELMTSEEAGFKGWPMPYDINIKTKGAGTLQVEYHLIPSRRESDITEEEMEDYKKLTPITQILDRMKAKQREKIEGGSAQKDLDTIYPDAEDEGIDPANIPF